jgi:cytochrome b pre-mRNA-processing protein 3
MNIAQPAQAARYSEARLSILSHIFGEKKARAALAPLYQAVVARGRDPFWYRDGQVPDTLDGRFDMVAAVTALVLLRLEALGEDGRGASVLLTEIFIDDMDATLRQIGIGDYVVGKHVGRMMGALGGRLTAFRAAQGGAFSEAVRRNVFHEAPPSEEAVALVAGRLEAFAAALNGIGIDALRAGDLP